MHDGNIYDPFFIVGIVPQYFIWHDTRQLRKIWYVFESKLFYAIDTYYFFFRVL